MRAERAPPPPPPVARAASPPGKTGANPDGEETVVYVEWQAPRYHGIQWDSGQHKWMARYKNPNTGERVIVGYYSDDIEAAVVLQADTAPARLGGQKR